MAWKDKCLRSLMDAKLFLSSAHMDRFKETWKTLKKQPFCTKGLCKCLFLSAWDQEHYQFLKDTVDEMITRKDTDTSYMLEKGRVVLDNVALSERELFKLSIQFLENEGVTPDDSCLMKLAHHWVPITDNTLEAGRLIDRLE
ncbi:MAG TPA: hypothetical protein H9672_04060 [Firmicutes bacterium]|nr:hypothetical protein [Bacillota bacterium]